MKLYETNTKRTIDEYKKYNKTTETSKPELLEAAEG